MKYITFISEVKDDNRIEIPPEIRHKLSVRVGDKLELTIKKIRARRLEILISENPLYKLVKYLDE